MGIEITEYIRAHSGLQIGLKKIKNGQYRFGRMKVNIVLVNEKALVRVGGGYNTLETFFNKYIPIELERIRKSVIMPKPTVIEHENYQQNESNKEEEFANKI